MPWRAACESLLGSQGLAIALFGERARKGELGCFAVLEESCEEEVTKVADDWESVALNDDILLASDSKCT